MPTSTYRIQVTASFDLHATARLLPYLRGLGVDWVYLSPLLAAEPGSDHGYDVVAHDRIDPARGGAEGLAAVSAEAERLGMGVLVDIVPNHVGVATPSENAWWWDVLRLGRGSAYATYFDVDWDTGDGRLRIPVVGDDDAAAIEVDVEAGEVRYHDNRYPLAPGTTTLAEQHYELVGWRTADDRLNYRRFFAVNTLAALRVEDREVFDASHVEIRRWFEEGLVDGLRVDHPDGLRDPKKYLDDLAELTGSSYVLVEKILEPGETLETDWATAGTTGYDVLGLVDRILTDPAGQRGLDALEARLRRHGVAWADWAALIHDTKRDVADGILGSEVNRIVRELSGSLVSTPGPGGPARPADTPGARPADSGGRAASAASGVETPDESPARPADASGGRPGEESGGRAASAASGVETPETLADAVAELIACFPVYRSYLPAGREHLDEAFASARERRPDLVDTLDTIEPLLSDPANDAAIRLQQTSGMVMAKGVEDCAFYRWSRLTSLTEVGGDPSDFCVDVVSFHTAMAERQELWPHAMTTTSTHDTKRGEDVRARIAVLAEVPDAWTQTLDRLLALAPLPDPGFGSLLWQAVLGAWPASPHPDLRDRLHAYAEKAMREAGDRTTWTAPDEPYEAAVHDAVDAAFDDDTVRATLDELLARITSPGWSNALSAKLVALTIPGVPDVYQGSELWEQSLVDPDNRRPVDFEQRQELLDGLLRGTTTDLGSGLDDPGAAKLAVVRAALTLRRERPHLLTSYTGLLAEGSAAAHVLAFDRGGAITVATRLPVGLAATGWSDTTLVLPDGTWVEQLSGRVVPGGTHPVADLLGDLPVALFALEDA